MAIASLMSQVAERLDGRAFEGTNDTAGREFAAYLAAHHRAIAAQM